MQMHTQWCGAGERAMKGGRRKGRERGTWYTVPAGFAGYLLAAAAAAVAAETSFHHPIYHPVLPALVPVKSVCVACLPAYLSAPCRHDLLEKKEKEKGKRRTSDQANPFTQKNVKKQKATVIFPHPGRSKMIFLGAYF
jgi:hypothetical protein